MDLAHRCAIWPEHLGLGNKGYRVWRCIDADGSVCQQCVRAVKKDTADGYLRKMRQYHVVAGPSCTAHGPKPKHGVAGVVRVVMRICQFHGISCPEVAIEVALQSEVDKGRSMERGRFTTGADCYLDVVMVCPSLIRGTSGLAIEVHGRDHNGKKAIARDVKRMSAADQTFDAIEVGAHDGIQSWWQAIESALMKTGRL